MKKIYIAPKIDVIILDSLCSGSLQTASVYQGSLDDKCISYFEVLGEEQTKTGTDSNACGESRTAASGATINTPLGCHSS